jgi:hypothetical protein
VVHVGPFLCLVVQGRVRSGCVQHVVSGWFATAWGREKGDILFRRGWCDGGERDMKFENCTSLRVEWEKSGVGEAPLWRTSVECGCGEYRVRPGVEKCCMWTPPLLNSKWLGRRRESRVGVEGVQ